MNWDFVEGKWDQFKGQVRERWGKLTDDDIQTIQGKRDYLLGKIKEKYGVTQEEAEKQIDDFSGSLH
jgi:uncharacterized protein YjbJ (UPF0337 family)